MLRALMDFSRFFLRLKSDTTEWSQFCWKTARILKLKAAINAILHFKYRVCWVTCAQCAQLWTICKVARMRTSGLKYFFCKTRLENSRSISRRNVFTKSNKKNKKKPISILRSARLSNCWQRSTVHFSWRATQTWRVSWTQRNKKLLKLPRRRQSRKLLSRNLISLNTRNNYSNRTQVVKAVVADAISLRVALTNHTKISSRPMNICPVSLQQTTM